jgi:hypothetical protein
MVEAEGELFFVAVFSLCVGLEEVSQGQRVLKRVVSEFLIKGIDNFGKMFFFCL